MRRIACGMAAVLVIAAAGSVAAQKTTQVHPGKGGSPHVRTEWTIDGANLSIEYGRPSLKGRPERPSLMPAGKPWRTGADEATVLKTDKRAEVRHAQPRAGHLHAEHAAGREGLAADRRQARQARPVGRALQRDARNRPRADDASRQAKAPVEQVTISIDDTPKGGTLKVEWGTKVATIPFTVG